MLLELEMIGRGEVLAWVAAECRKTCAEDLVSVRCPKSCGCRRALGKLICLANNILSWGTERIASVTWESISDSA